MSLVGGEIFKELGLISGVSAKGSVNSFEAVGSGGWEELVDDGLENMCRLIEGDSMGRLDDAKVEIFKLCARLSGEIKHAAEMIA